MLLNKSLFLSPTSLNFIFFNVIVSIVLIIERFPIPDLKNKIPSIHDMVLPKHIDLASITDNWLDFRLYRTYDAKARGEGRLL